ncbi:hydrogen/calcium exchanger domain-containing protein [Aspergillus puulaauensis]|uniref:Vacuolar calcium ion transporter n=1 Tax=Aspergillus puulaauensis TaxID=1220207 RepID=A0A7R7Y0I6_9EURO|nr:uncharacterized protein APUU_80531S [Aspergillus puulaauensis]BCS30228.1 hypothetical protein APUU_80531S [Aspergillus puulaauensis]
MHRYKSAARNLAWYDQDGEPTIHNPFKKFRRSPRRSNSIQLESRLAPTRTADAASPAEERRRNRELREGLGDPIHPDTYPPPTGMTADSRPRTDSMDKPDPSMNSSAPINVTPRGHDGIESNGKPRKRRFLGIGNRSDGDDREIPEEEPDKQRFTAVGQFKATVLNSWINILLVAAPVGIALNYVKVDPVAVFVVNFIAIIPLAAMLSFATEEIALRTGETIGGLLNATFGNAVELIVAIIALVDNEVLIVQTSLIGSMLSNLLLVLGMCFFFGGLNRLEQHFNPVVAQTAASLLSLAVGSLIIPTAFHAWSGVDDETKVVPLSRGTSVIMLIIYGCYLYFQLKSHTEIYNAPSQKAEKIRQKVSEGDASRGIAQIGHMSAALAGSNKPSFQNPDDVEEEPQLHIWVAILTLAISTAFVALCAEYMVNSIDALTERGGISKTFVGLILLPIVGNAAEHATAVTVAIKDKMDLAIGVAVGSSMQIALLVLPLIVVIGWIKGNDDMTLYFDAFQVILLFVSVLLVNYLIGDGKSHWLEGVLLMMMYVIISVAAWFYPSTTTPVSSGA